MVHDMRPMCEDHLVTHGFKFGDKEDKGRNRFVIGLSSQVYKYGANYRINSIVIVVVKFLVPLLAYSKTDIRRRRVDLSRYTHGFMHFLRNSRADCSRNSLWQRIREYLYTKSSQTKGQ